MNSVSLVYRYEEKIVFRSNFGKLKSWEINPRCEKMHVKNALQGQNVCSASISTKKKKLSDPLSLFFRAFHRSVRARKKICH